MAWQVREAGTGTRRQEEKERKGAARAFPPGRQIYQMAKKEGEIEIYEVHARNLKPRIRFCPALGGKWALLAFLVGSPGGRSGEFSGRDGRGLVRHAIRSERGCCYRSGVHQLGGAGQLRKKGQKQELGRKKQWEGERRTRCAGFEACALVGENNVSRGRGKREGQRRSPQHLQGSRWMLAPPAPDFRRFATSVRRIV